MISRGAAISFMAVSLVIANVIVFRAFSRGRKQSEEDHVYRYSRNFGKFFLFMIPVFAGMDFVIWSSGSKPPAGSDLVLFSAFAVLMVGFPLFGYAYAMRYGVSVDGPGVTIASLFRTRFIAFSDIAALATMRGKEWIIGFSRPPVGASAKSVGRFRTLSPCRTMSNSPHVQNM